MNEIAICFQEVFVKVYNAKKLVENIFVKNVSMLRASVTRNCGSYEPAN